MAAAKARGLPPEQGRLLTADEVAERLGGAVTPRWVRAHVRPRVELHQKAVRWWEADVDAWLAARRTGRAA